MISYCCWSIETLLSAVMERIILSVALQRDDNSTSSYLITSLCEMVLMVTTVLLVPTFSRRNSPEQTISHSSQVVRDVRFVKKCQNVIQPLSTSYSRSLWWCSDMTCWRISALSISFDPEFLNQMVAKNYLQNREKLNFGLRLCNEWVTRTCRL